MLDCDTLPKRLAGLIDTACEGMDDCERIRALMIVTMTLRFAREQYDQVGQALKHSEPDLIACPQTVRR